MDTAAVAGAVWIPTTWVGLLKHRVAGIFGRLGGRAPWGFMGNILDIKDTSGLVGDMDDPVCADPAEAVGTENVVYLRQIFAATCRSKQDFLTFLARAKKDANLHVDTRITLFCGLSNPQEIHPEQEEIHPEQGGIHPAQGEIHPAQGEINPAQGEIHPAQGEIHAEQHGLHLRADVTNTMGWGASQLGVKRGREDTPPASTLYLPPTSPTSLESWANGAAPQQNTEEPGHIQWDDLGQFDTEFFFPDKLPDNLPASLPFFASTPDNLPASLPFFASTRPSLTLTEKGPISLADFSVDETYGLNDECLFIITGPTRVSLRPLMIIANQLTGILSVGTWLSRPSMTAYLRHIGLAEPQKKPKTQWKFGTV
ncbi:hypothetical protein T484DRAFT_1754660 [Baffinella frigidus]|nr:hypothetical protein T484DRAFT_1754660 [Cryptophyta sp. CCMP2293]